MIRCDMSTTMGSRRSTALSLCKLRSKALTSTVEISNCRGPIKQLHSGASRFGSHTTQKTLGRFDHQTLPSIHYPHGTIVKDY
jgi:hypothetical protein